MDGDGDLDAVFAGDDFNQVQEVWLNSVPEIDVLGKSQSITNGDTTPSTADDTDFGSASVNRNTVSHTFTISNTGDADLNLTGTPNVELATGSHFNVSTQPVSSTIEGGNAVTFEVTFAPTAEGSLTDTVTIVNNDANENPYTFVIGGVGTGAPEIELQGNGQTIINGATVPSTTNHTDFGGVTVGNAPVTHTFTISNTGNTNLTLTGAPAVTLTNGVHFSVSQPATTTIGADAAATFTVTFDPSAEDSFTDTVNIANSDADENPYTFVISGVGVAPPETVTDIDPAAGNHNAPLNATLAITLSGAIQESSVTSQTVFVHGGGRGQMDGAITFGSILYDPTDNFFPGELVQTSVTPGILGDSGIAIVPYVWQFRAAAGVGPATLFTNTHGLGSSASESVALGDLDGDGDLDAFVANADQANQVWLNNGAGVFSDSGANLGSSASKGVYLGDVDGDGDLDAFVANYEQADQVWLNDGAGAFTDTLPGLGSSRSYGVFLGDVDGDGDLDAFVANIGSNKVWLNDGAGVFSDSGANLGSASSFDVYLGDVDGDGDLDAFVANSYPNNKLWLNDGAGGFSDSGADLGDGNNTDVALGDLDGDSDLDAIVARLYGTARVWLNDGTGVFTDSVPSLESAKSYGVYLGDVDGDGDLDAFVANQNQANQVWLNDGAGVFTDTLPGLGSSASKGVSLGDVDGDGDLDAFVANKDQANQVWLNQPAAAAYTLTVNIAGAGEGVVNLNPSGGVYDAGTEVTMTAVVSSGFYFGGWSGNASGTMTETTVTMDSDKVVTATFTTSPPVIYSLTVNVEGNGTVTKTPSQTTYLSGATVSLAATADSGWLFSGWSGALNGSTTPADLLMDDDKVVTATFVEGSPTPSYTLSVNTAGDGAGAVTLNPSGGVYDAGTLVTMTAVVTTGYFGGWSGAVETANNPQTITMDSDKVVTATFTTSPPVTYTLTVNVVGNGTVTPSGGTYISGTNVILSAAPDAGWQFDGWSGSLSLPDGSLVLTIPVTMDQDRTVTATFSEAGGFKIYLPLVLK